jgi:hypothetical protein
MIVWAKADDDNVKHTKSVIMILNSNEKSIIGGEAVERDNENNERSAWI